MGRYFFDTRIDDESIADDVGLDFPGVEDAEAAAAKSLAELAVELLPGSRRRCLRVEVRDVEGRPLLSTELRFETRPGDAGGA